MNVDPSNVVGRVAQLVDLKAKSELNDSYVEIISYDPASSRFAVRTLVSPTLSTPSIMVSVKILNLKLTACFTSLHPTARVVLGSTFSALKGGSATAVYDFSSCRVYTGGLKSLMNVDTTCCIKGLRHPSRVPTTRFEAVVFIKCPNPDAVVEFQDIHFASGSGEHMADFGVYCMCAANVLFKNCRFSDMKVGCLVGSELGPVNAVFENCVFEDNVTADFVAAEEGHATLLNCVLRRSKSGIRIEDRGNAVLKHCVITDVSEAGASMYAKGNSLEMVNCTVGPTHSLLASGVCINRSGDLLLRGCLIQGTAAGAIGLDGVRSAIVENCTLRDSVNGVLLTTGDNNLTMTHCHIDSIREMGVAIGRGCTGSVNITCDPADHICRRAYNDGGPKCRVTVDGQLFGPAVLTTTHDREFLERSQEDLSKDVGCELDRKNIINRMKAQKKAGTGNVQCFNCDKIEPEDVKFKLCSKCTTVCYCSRECQADHWKAHKKDCKARVAGGTGH